MQDMEQIYQQYFHTVYRYLRCLTGRNDSLAEELCQETFYQAVKSVHRYRGECAIPTWLCQIARHVWMHELQKKRYRKEISLEASLEQNSKEFLFQHLISKSDTEKTALSRLQSRKALEAIQQLEAVSQKVLLYRLVGELSFREIGDILGHSENWARVTFFRGRKKLKETLGDDII